MKLLLALCLLVVYVFAETSAKPASGFADQAREVLKQAEEKVKDFLAEAKKTVEDGMDSATKAMKNGFNSAQQAAEKFGRSGVGTETNVQNIAAV